MRMFEELDRSELEELATRIYAALYGCVPPEGAVPPTEQSDLVEKMAKHIETMVAKTAEDMKQYRQQSDMVLRTKISLRMLCEELGFSLSDTDDIEELAEMALAEINNRFIPNQQATKTEVALLRAFKQFIMEQDR